LLGAVVLTGMATVGLALYLFWPREAEANRDFEYARVQVIVPQELKGKFGEVINNLSRKLAKENCLIEVADTLFLKMPAPEQTLLIQRVPNPPVADRVAKYLKIRPSRVIEKSLDDNIKGVLFSVYLGQDVLAAH